MAFYSQNIRPNLPTIHTSAFIDPSAQIIGNVRIGADVFVGPLAVVRADEPGADGSLGAIIIEGKANIHDGVIMRFPHVRLLTHVPL